MPEPLSKIQVNNRTGDERTVFSYDGGDTWVADAPDVVQPTGESTGELLPPPREEMSADEASWRGAGSGLSFGSDKEMFAMGAAAAPSAPRSAGRAIDAPLMPEGAQSDMAFTDALNSYTAAQDRAAYEQPTAYHANEFAGELFGAMAIPQMRAAKMASLPAHAVRGAGNMGIDAAVGGTAAYGASEADTLEGRLSDAGTGAGISLAGGSILRGAMGAPRAIVKGGQAGARAMAKTRALPESPGASRTVDEFLDEPTPAPGPASQAIGDLDAAKAGPRSQGAEARRLAVEGTDTDAAARALHTDLRKMEDVKDIVLADAGVNLKPQKIAPRFEADGIRDSAKVRMENSAIVDEVEALSNHFRNEAGRIKGMGAGATAMSLVDKAVASYKQVVGDRWSSNVAEGPEGVAQVYSAMDQLKRHIGVARKKAGRGEMRDAGAADALSGLYENLRGHLENEAIWGKGAVEFQRETNKVWTQAIPSMREFGKRFNSRAAEARSAGDVFDTVQLIGSENTESFVKRAGSAGNVDAEAAVRAYVKDTPQLLKVLSEYYEVPTSALGGLDDAAGSVTRSLDTMTGDASGAAERISSGLDETIDTADAVRRLRELKEETPRVMGIPGTSPADTINMIGKGERIAKRHEGKLSAGSDIKYGVGKASRALHAYQGASRQKADNQYTSNTDMVEGLAQTNPEALGKYGQQLAQASQMGPDGFTAKHQNLMETDPAYRQLMRELEGVEE